MENKPDGKGVKTMTTVEMKRILEHLDRELTLTGPETPWLIYAQMLDRVSDAMRQTHELVIS